MCKNETGKKKTNVNGPHQTTIQNQPGKRYTQWWS